MNKLLKVATILAVIAVTYRTVTSLLHIEKMVERWYEVDFEINHKPSINLNLGGATHDNYESFAKQLNKKGQQFDHQFDNH